VVGNASLLALLPRVSSEIGDTWLHGSASEPVRSAFFKRASALRAQCVAAGAPQCAAGDPVVNAEALYLNFFSAWLSSHVKPLCLLVDLKVTGKTTS
jgi:hypothetical protein